MRTIDGDAYSGASPNLSQREPPGLSWDRSAICSRFGRATKINLRVLLFRGDRGENLTHLSVLQLKVDQLVGRRSRYPAHQTEKLNEAYLDVCGGYRRIPAIHLGRSTVFVPILELRVRLQHVRDATHRKVGNGELRTGGCRLPRVRDLARQKAPKESMSAKCPGGENERKGLGVRGRPRRSTQT